MSDPKIDPGSDTGRTAHAADAQVQELERENARLRELVQKLETEKSLATAFADDACAQFRETEQKLADERSRRYLLEGRLERQVARLSSLYVAAHRLSQARDREEGLGIVSEIIANLVGSEEFGVYELTPAGDHLQLLTSMGIDATRFRRVGLDDGRIAEVVRSGETYVAEDFAEEGLRACFPLRVRGEVRGAVAIFGLLPQKLALEPFDREIFDLLAVQAARALVCDEAQHV